jgi:tetratricopeptide (TPR) repeat protein
VLLSEFRWLSPEEAYAPARDAARKALELDQTLTEAYTALAWLSWRHDWDWQSAEREYRRAIELNPSDVESHQGLSWYLAWKHRSSEAQAEVAKIRELDPAQDAAIDEAAIYYHQRQYPALVEAGRKSVAARSDYWVGHYFLAVGYEGSGRLSDAIAEYRNAVEISQEDVDALAGLAHAYAVSGKPSEAKEILKRLQQAAGTSYVSPYMIATIYAGLGEKDKALEYLEKAYEERSTDLPYFLSADLRLDALRSDPRFRNLVQKVGLHE